MECLLNAGKSAVKSDDLFSNLVLVVDLAPLEKKPISIKQFWSNHFSCSLLFLDDALEMTFLEAVIYFF